MRDDGLVQTLPEPGGATASISPEPGTSIGRFVVLGVLGMGGMGVVLAAYDPQLDRKVALKLLRDDVWSGASGERGTELLLREAQTMARLAHPNVVTVHEVGLLEERVYLVMEQVEGTTLRGWLAEATRPWPEIVELVGAAGSGLAAAHRIGVVHRDFKPDNVLVARDGRPRVADFGIVAGATAAGTPAYMAPEQRDGGAIDARSDQYAFCVTLWEALVGERPPPDLVVPASTRAPAWLFRVLRRGLARDPEDRWPSLDALLARLRRRTQLGARVAVAGGALAIAAAAAVLVIGRDADAALACDGGAARLAGVWDAPTRAAVHAAFAAPGVPYGEAVWQTASTRIDDYTRAWTAMYADACRATHVEHRQSEALLDLRMGCLERRRAVLAGLTELWRKGTTVKGLEAAVDGARDLPPLAECGDARTLTERSPLPPDPVTRVSVAASRAELDAARALGLANRRPEARQRVRAARAMADRTGWVHVRAEAALVEGQVLAALEEPSAQDALVEASRLAGAARDDRITADALIELVHHLAEGRQQAERALLVADLADGVVLRAGDDPTLRMHLTRFRGAALRTKGDLPAARALFTDNVARAVASFGANSWEAIANIGELASVVDAQGEYTEAFRLGEQAVAGSIALYGADHPRVAVFLGNLAHAAEGLGDLDAAATHYRRALAIKEAVTGPDSASTATTLNNLGVVEMSRGRVDDAERAFERALAIRERVLGRDHGYVATTLGNLAAVRRARGRFAEALAMLDRALAIKLAEYGPAHASVAVTLSGIAHLMAATGDLAGALRHHQRALEIRKQALGAQHSLTLTSTNRVASTLVGMGRCRDARPLLAGTLGARQPADVKASILAHAQTIAGECELVAGRPARAVELIERALAEAEQPTVDMDFGDARWTLARALWALGRREDSLAMARRAARELALDATDARLLATVRAWLVAREGPATNGREARDARRDPR
jgi:eukaryotic-like serine/threonine-protein kinase